MYVYIYMELILSLNEQEETVHDFLDVIEVDDKTREMNTKCQSFRFDISNIAYKHNILRETIIGQSTRV